MQFLVALALTIVGSVAYWYVQTRTVCPAPLHYRLGAYDERFLLPPQEVVAVLKEAEAVWEEAVGRELFVYDDTSDFTIDFVFDERQRRAVSAELTREELDAQAVKTEVIRQTVDRLTREYDTLREKYRTRVTQYEGQLAVHNREVESYNSTGGVPPEKQSALEAAVKRLRTEQGALEAMARDLNELVAELNRARAEGNALVAAYNEEVATYNDHYGEAGAFTQGEYVGDRIVIYKYTDTTELRQVVVHELGHALGANHVENPVAIMYHMLEQQPDELIIHEEDVGALVAACGNGNEWSHRLRRGIRTMLSLFN